MTQKTKTKDSDTVTKDIETSTDISGTDEVPEWSDLAEELNVSGAKKSTLLYLIGGASVMASSSFFLPLTIGFPFAILVLGFISGLFNKGNIAGAGVAGLIGGLGSTAITGGLTAILTVVPLLLGGFVSLVAGVLGVVLGGYIYNKIR